MKEISGWYKKNLPTFGLGAASAAGPAKIEEKKEENKVEERKEVYITYLERYCRC
jgi:hypothetical protein